MVRTLRQLAPVILLLAVTAGAAQTNQKISPKAQERITKEVRHRILMLVDFGTFDNIAFKLNGYDLVLLGQVTRPSLKDDAGRAVQKIEGVERVENRIEVLPASFNDDRLRRDLFNAIYRYGPLQHYGVGSNRPIRIIVNRGNVTLEGVVDRQSDKTWPASAPTEWLGCSPYKTISLCRGRAGNGGVSSAQRDENPRESSSNLHPSFPNFDKSS